RDMGVAVQSKALAVFFDKVLRRDMALERAGAGVSGLIPVAAPEADLVAAAPSKLPPLVAWKTFTPTRLVSVIPVLSPDNYMDVVPGSARQRHQIDRHRTAVHPRHSTRSCQATRGDPRRSLPQQEARDPYCSRPPVPSQPIRERGRRHSRARPPLRTRVRHARADPESPLLRPLRQQTDHRRHREGPPQLAELV